MALPVATVLPDRGASAATDEHFFRSAQFHMAESVTHSLTISLDNERLLSAGIVVRSIPGFDDIFDATSAYGYPGARRWATTPIAVDQVEWSSAGLVSLFLRERVGGSPGFVGGTVRNELQIMDPHRPLAMRQTHARHIRRNLRLGYTTALLRGPSADVATRDSFRSLYIQTMARRRALAQYFFDREYFAAIFNSYQLWMLLTRAPEGRAASAGIVVESDGMLHYYLGGTASEFLHHSPFKNTVAGMVDLAMELQLPLNLGGGIRPGDDLERFKHGFANSTAPFLTHDLICDATLYTRLSKRSSADGFFPAYRTPT
jgi:hypothetical protein